MKADTALSLERMCALGQVSRAGWYRRSIKRKRPEDEVRLRSEIQKIALQWPAYGSRRITAELRRRDWAVNRKRVQRLMRADNLLCLRKRRFMITTDSSHNLRVYSNLARKITLTGVDQLWRADITYIRLESEFVYLAVILDAFSRRVIGWALDSRMEDSLTLDALRRALAQRHLTPGLVHHSDRGVQYASGAYIQLLKQHHIRISMSRRANPWDNAACESFMKTLKSEEVHRTEYRDLADARRRVGQFLEAVYNRKRLHSALDYRSPEEFERNLKKEAAARQPIA